MAESQSWLLGALLSAAFAAATAIPAKTGPGIGCVAVGVLLLSLKR